MAAAEGPQEKDMPEMHEDQIFEAFGLERPAEDAGGQGAPQGEGGEALQQPGETGEAVMQTQAAAQEQQDDAAPQEGADAAEEGENEQDTAEPAPQQSAQERREQAAARRRREQQEAIDRAVTAARAEERKNHDEAMKEFFASAGLTDSLTGKPITTMEEFRSWKRSYDTEKLEQELQSGKLSRETLERAISENPIVQRANEVIRASEEAKRANELAAAQARAEAEIKEINELDPEAKLERVEDLLKMDNAKEFYDFVKKGNSFVDAYKLANYDRLAARRAEAAKQQALQLARSKDHLNGAGVSRGSGSASVPQDQMQMFRLINPNASEEEIRRYYNKYNERK